MVSVPSNRKSSPAAIDRSSGRTPKLAALPTSAAGVSISTRTDVPSLRVIVVGLPAEAILAGMMFIAGEPMKRATNRLAGRS
ncbi:hypothetical protein D3C80_1801190 [compost metagenome]